MSKYSYVITQTVNNGDGVYTNLQIVGIFSSALGAKMAMTRIKNILCHDLGYTFEPHTTVDNYESMIDEQVFNTGVVRYCFRMYMKETNDLSAWPFTVQK